MALFEVDDTGAVGLVTDIVPTRLDKNVWTKLDNGSARNDVIGSFEFFSELFVFPRAARNDDEVITALGDFENNVFEASENWAFFFKPTPLGELILSVYSFISFDRELFIYCSMKRVYCQDTSGAIYDITPADFEFESTMDLGWSGIVFGGILILNNGIDEPHYWVPTVEDQLATKLKPLSEAPGESPWPTGWSCRTIKGFKSALFACNITTDEGNSLPYYGMFSDFSEPGTLPREWIASASNSAGDFDLADDFGEIVDALSFRDQIIIWKERSVYGFRYSGGNQVYQRFTISTETGLLARNCLTNTDEFQVAITSDDLVVCDGSRLQSIANGRTRKGFYSTIDSINFRKSFVYHNKPNSEVWFFRPTRGNTFCNKALVFDYSNNTFVEKSFLGATGAVNSFRVLADEPAWQEVLTEWSNTDRIWNAPFLGETVERTMISLAVPVDETPEGETLYNSTLLVRGRNLFDGPGDRYPFVAERLSIPLPRGDKVDWASMKQVQYIVPKLESVEEEENFSMRVYMGFQWDQADTIRWVGPKIWKPGKKRMFFDEAGRFVSLRFEVDPGVPFELSGFNLEYKLVSRY